MVTKLSKLSMPPAKSGKAKSAKSKMRPEDEEDEDMLLLDPELDLEGLADDSEQEEDPLSGDEDMSGEGLEMGLPEDEAAAGPDLSTLSDDDILAEMRKRGLAPGAGAEEDPEDDQSMYS